MGITLTTGARNAACDAIVDLADVGSTDASADCVIMTSGDVEVATCVMSAPAFGAAATGVATAASITSDTSATGGTAALFKIQDRDNAEAWRGTATATGGGGDLQLSTVTIPAGATVSISSMTVTMPAS